MIPNHVVALWKDRSRGAVRIRIPLHVLLLTSPLYIIASVVTTILSDEKVNKQNGDSDVEQDHHDDQDGS